MNLRRAVILTLMIGAIIGAIWLLESSKEPVISQEELSESKINIHIDNMDKEEKAKQYPSAIEISSPDGYINTDGVTISEFIGKKIILVDFWTYSCINCQRTTPYLNAWHEKYKDDGLVIIGIHTPEFDFEKDIENVKTAVEKFKIEYPVVLDNDYSTWRAYKNRYWPRKYIIDIDGFIVYDHIGEGAYTETEMKIQELLEERAGVLALQNEIIKDISNPSGAQKVDAFAKRSPEIYFGAWRNSNLGNGVSGVEEIRQFIAPDDYSSKNVLYLDGEWGIYREYAENKDPVARIIFHYEGQKVFMVASAENEVEAEITIDGKPLGEKSGQDIAVKDGRSIIYINDDKLYNLIDDPDGNNSHIMEIIIKNPGLKAYTFTFG